MDSLTTSIVLQDHTICITVSPPIYFIEITSEHSHYYMEYEEQGLHSRFRKWTVINHIKHFIHLNEIESTMLDNHLSSFKILFEKHYEDGDN